MAAYTTTDAKQRINTAAGMVIEEIVTNVMPFAEPSAEEDIRLAIRRIVKLGVEVWRFARLEREMIEASMPEIFSEEGEEDGFWQPQPFDSAAYPVNAVKPVFENQQGMKQLLLRVFPMIRREPIHQCFRVKDHEMDDEGCVYSPGMALYSDSPPVLARLAELRRSSGSVLQNPFSDSHAIDHEMAMPRLQPTSMDLPPINTPAPLPPSTWQSPSPGLSTPLRQRRSKSPPSPLFAAVGEIDSLNNRYQYPQSPIISRTGTVNSHRHGEDRPISSATSWPSSGAESPKEVVEVGRSRYEGRDGYNPQLRDDSPAIEKVARERRDSGGLVPL
jgi:hypothetical protein